MTNITITTKNKTGDCTISAKIPDQVANIIMQDLMDWEKRYSGTVSEIKKFLQELEEDKQEKQ